MQLAATGLPDLSGTSATPLGGNIVLSGGISALDGLCGSQAFASTGVWNGSSWMELAVPTPQSDSATMATFCPNGCGTP